MSRRPVLVTERYHPRGRSIVVEAIPATEIVFNGRTDVVLDASDAPELHIAYTPSDVAAAG